MGWIEYAGLTVNVLMAIIAVAAVYISRKIYVDSTSPEIIVYLQLNHQDPYIIDLVIENIGKAAATDVKFTSSKPVPYQAYEADKYKLMEDGPIIKGIPFFAPNAKRVIQFGLYKGIEPYLKDDKIQIESTCRGKQSFLFFTRKIKTVSYLDIYSFEISDVSDNSNSKKVHKELTSIRKALEALVLICTAMEPFHLRRNGTT